MKSCYDVFGKGETLQMNNDPAPGTNGNGSVEDLWVDFVLLFISIFG
jgi:hypothetical protein